MTRTRFLLPLVGLALALASCNGPKSLSKRAGELHAVGFNQQAADLYAMALRKRPGYVDAMIGLKMTGQGVGRPHRRIPAGCNGRTSGRRHRRVRQDVGLQNPRLQFGC